jgi:hypothetical protein
MVKKQLTIVVLLIFGFGLFAQEEKKEEFKPSGKAIGKVFWNFNYNLTDGVEQKTSFAIQRVYFGYNYNFSEKISAVILFDGAKKTLADVNFNKSEKTLSSEYTVFVKNAFVNYKITSKIALSGGMIELKQMDTQDKFYG